jgi:NADP-dependent aldehyde dehydrogenase
MVTDVATYRENPRPAGRDGPPRSRCASPGRDAFSWRAAPRQLTATIHRTPRDPRLAGPTILRRKRGGSSFNGFPTGVAVSHAMHHGGRIRDDGLRSTSVGTVAIHRFTRPVCYQTFPRGAAEELQDSTRAASGGRDGG